MMLDLDSEHLSKSTIFGIALVAIVASTLSVNVGMIIGDSIYGGGVTTATTTSMNDLMDFVPFQSSSNNENDDVINIVPHPHFMNRRHLQTTVTDPQQKLDLIREILANSTSATVKDILQTIPATANELVGKELDDQQLPEIRAAAWIVHQDTSVAYGTVEEYIIPRFVLAMIYYNNGGIDWTNNKNWLITDTSYCDWYGVTCCKNFLFSPVCADPTANPDGITELDLHKNNLIGTISPIISQLTDLQVIWFSENYIEGNIPADAFINLPKLLRVYLQHNKLTGTVPDIFTNTLNIVDSYYVHGNDLSGNVTDNFCPPKLTNFGVDCQEVQCNCCEPTSQCFINPPRT